MILFETFPQKSNNIGGNLPDRSTNGSDRCKFLFAVGSGCGNNAAGVGCDKLAQAWTQQGPGPSSRMHFPKIFSTWFEAEAGFRIEIWTRQYRKIVQNFDARLMELTLVAPDLSLIHI